MPLENILPQGETLEFLKCQANELLTATDNGAWAE